jgi:hypothetical protein
MTGKGFYVKKIFFAPTPGRRAWYGRSGNEKLLNINYKISNRKILDIFSGRG